MTSPRGALCAEAATTSEVGTVFARRETHHTLGERGILGDEAIAELHLTIEQLQVEVAELRSRVDSQFTTIAAHAEIARQQAEFARNEARSDLDRSRETLIGLIEQVRTDGEVSVHLAGNAPGASIGAANERLDTVERNLTRVADSVERCLARQSELADTMAAFLDTVLAEQRGEPVAGLTLT
jgi:ElaB/YqjD/DUF883 family membrane-anchored ribosome-binding protein